MPRVETIVVGGGISAVAPFTLNSVPFVSSADPASLSTTDFMSVVPTGATRGLVIGASDPDVIATERLRVLGGILSEHADVAESVSLGQRQTVVGTFSAGPLLIGRDLTISTAAASANEPILVGVDISVTSTAGNLSSVVAIGSNITLSATTYQGIVIGRSVTSSAPGGGETLIGNSITSGTGQDNIAIGDGAVLTGTGSTNVIVGRSVSKATGVANSVAIGGSATLGAGSSSSVAIGAATSVTALECVVIGHANVATHAQNVLIGRGVNSFQAQTCMIGATVANPITTVVIGGPTNTVNGNGSNLTIRQTNTSGADRTAGNLTIVSGMGTGAGTVSSISLQTPTVLGAGAVAQTPTTRAQFDSGAGATTTGMLLWDVDTGTLARVTVGAAGSGGVGFKLLRIPN